MTLDVYDLQLVNGDLAFGPDDEPRYVAGVDAVAQDVRHRLLESGTVPAIVGEDAAPESALAAIALEVEDDTRVVPGTAAAEVATPDPARPHRREVTVTARTTDGKTVEATATT